MNLLTEVICECVMKIHGNQIIGNDYFTASFIITHPENFNCHSNFSVACMEWYRVWQHYIYAMKYFRLIIINFLSLSTASCGFLIYWALPRICQV